MKKIKYVIMIILVFSIDQISKLIISNSINLNGSVEVIKNFFSLTYVKNKGAAFGMFSSYTFIISLISVLILIYLLFELFRSKSEEKLTNYSLSLIIGGLLGNLYDRVFLGCVRDFFDFTLLGKGFAIFNVGDAFIVIGCFMFIISVFLEVKNENSSK